jgi:hypothetical protein
MKIFINSALAIAIGMALLCLPSCAGDDPINVTGNIEGTVTDYESTQAISGVMVDIVANANTTFAKQSRQTGNDGKFAFKDLEAGSYKLSFSRSGYLENNQDVNILAGQTVSSDVRLSPASPFKVQSGVLMSYSGADGDVVIPDNLGITSIGNSMFENNTLLHSVTIPTGVTSIGISAFKECTQLSSVSLPSTLVTIESEAFYWCAALHSVRIPDNVTTIGQSAFFLCSNVESLTISNKATSIGTFAFGSCLNLKSITIPVSVRSIDSYAFFHCVALSSVFVGWATPLGIPYSTFEGVTLSNVTLHVPSGAKALYQTAGIWEDFGTIVEY